MIIRGKERGFFLTVGAACEIADLCVDGDIQNLRRLFEGKYSQNYRNIAKFIVAMNRGYEERMHPDAEKPDVLTVREVMALTDDEFYEAEMEAISAYANLSKTTVETKPAESSKKNESKSED